MIGSAGFGLSELLLAPVRSTLMASVLLFIAGLCFTTWSSSSNSLVQLATPDHLRGRVIGINSQIETGGSGNGSVGIGFAVPIDTAKRYIPQLKKEGRVDRGYLGVSTTTIDKSLQGLNLPREHGALVQSVTPGSPADKAGIRAGDISATLDGQDIQLGGDIITEVDGKAINSNEDLTEAIAGRKQGDKVKVKIVRGDKEKTVEVTLGDRPASADATTTTSPDQP